MQLELLASKGSSSVSDVQQSSGPLKEKGPTPKIANGITLDSIKKYV
jgi:hypothetical protein